MWRLFQDWFTHRGYENPRKAFRLTDNVGSLVEEGDNLSTSDGPLGVSQADIEEEGRAGR